MLYQTKDGVSLVIYAKSVKVVFCFEFSLLPIILTFWIAVLSEVERDVRLALSS